MAKFTKKKIAVLTVGFVLVGGGAAFAYWTAGGSGTGSASTASSVANVTVVQTSTISGMAPGDSPQALSGTFTNPNTSPVYVTRVTASIASVTVGGVAAVGCDATDYTLTGAAMDVNAEVSPDDTTPWSGATIQFKNKATNQDACKGATVNLAYTVS